MFVGLDKCTQVREEMSLSNHLQFIEVMKEKFKFQKKGEEKPRMVEIGRLLTVASLKMLGY